MINALHVLVYADDPAAARAFFRDVLEWPNVDAHDGWLIFKTGPSELGVHPTGAGGADAARASEQHHQISLMCADIAAAVTELKAKGVEFTRDVRDDGFGLTAMLQVPGAGELMIYQAKHPLAYDL